MMVQILTGPLIGGSFTGIGDVANNWSGHLVIAIDPELFGFAGVYNDFKDAEGDPFYTCAILTTTPNKIVSKIHNRMPVIIQEKDEETWLVPENKLFRFSDTLFGSIRCFRSPSGDRNVDSPTQT